MNPTGTPVLFTIFNRPALTAASFAAIRAAAPSRLYVAADGPRPDHPGDLDACATARQIATAVDWPCTLLTLLRQHNAGCRQAMSEAITWFFAHEEAGIVLEDDCVANASFFPFCAELLERYRDDERVMCVSGDNFLPPGDSLGASYYFSIYNHTWGWASWARAWRLYDPTLEGLDEFLAARAFSGMAQFDDVAARWEDRFRRTRDNRLDSWAVAWTFSCWANNGLTCTPCSNLVSNTGFGADATHTFEVTSPGSRVPTIDLEFPLTHPTMMAANGRLDAYVSRHLYQIDSVPSSRLP